MTRHSRMQNAASAWIALVVCASTQGCGMLKEMVKDPGLAQTTMKLAQEPVPLPVVVRRADVATATATQVDRLLTATPVDTTSNVVRALYHFGRSVSDLARACRSMGEGAYDRLRAWCACQWGGRVEVLEAGQTGIEVD